MAAAADERSLKKTDAVSVVLKTEVNYEKRSFEVLLCTRDGSQSKKYVHNIVLSYQNTFDTLQ